MKARPQSLHDKGGQLRAGKVGDAHKLDDVRMSEGAHQLALPHEPILYFGFVDLGVALEQVFVDGFGGADGSSYDHFLHAAVGTGTDISASFSHVDFKLPQLLHHFCQKGGVSPENFARVVYGLAPSYEFPPVVCSADRDAGGVRGKGQMVFLQHSLNSERGGCCLG